ncbi:MAG TPA: MarR family transcriptional regulator [Solirubrobacteraceae bacterium]
MADSTLSIRAALNRKALADARHRAALAREFACTEKEVLAVQHLGRAGELTPGQLGAHLQLSSGGTTALLHRLLRAGHITRDAHPRDGRSTVLRLTETMQESATEAWAPLVSGLDALALELSKTERDVVVRFLERAAETTERHADRLARDADMNAFDRLAAPLPALWA